MEPLHQTCTCPDLPLGMWNFFIKHVPFQIFIQCISLEIRTTFFFPLVTFLKCSSLWICYWQCERYQFSPRIFQTFSFAIISIWLIVHTCMHLLWKHRKCFIAFEFVSKCWCGTFLECLWLYERYQFSLRIFHTFSFYKLTFKFVYALPWTISILFFMCDC